MALFKNDADKNLQPESSVKPQSSPVEAFSVPPLAAERNIERPGQLAPREACAYLDQGAKVTGKLSFEGPARIDGQVDGEINAKDIVIGESAVVTAQIAAASIVIAGTVRGEIAASQRIEIRPSAKVSGNITAPKLVVQEGATFDGHCAMQTEGARDHRKAAAHRPGEHTAAQADGQVQAR
jgi:cytoskeletal protein CcmA (bactofilin family)